MKLKLLLLGLLLISVKTASADVTLDFAADQLQFANGTPMTTNGLVLVVADTNNTGFSALEAGASLSVNSDITGTGDRIVGTFDLSEFGGNGAFANSTDDFKLSNVTNWTAGDGLELVWLPTDTLSSTTLTAGTTYGAFAGPTGSYNENWTTPTDGQGQQYFFFTTAAETLSSGGDPVDFPSNEGLADKAIEAVPEPNSMALSLFGFGALLYVLRRKRAHL